MNWCFVCGSNLQELTEIKKVHHLNGCLDLEQLSTQLDPDDYPEVLFLPEEAPTQMVIKEHTPVEVKHYPVDMPDYDQMDSVQLKTELDKWGFKQNLNTLTSREVLKQTWLFLTKGIFPKFLESELYK